MIVAMERKHCADIARLHCASLPSDFLSALGTLFLKRIFYPGIIESPDAFGYVSLEKNSVVGFIAGSYNSTSTYRHIVYSRMPLFAICLCAAIIRKPSIISRILQTVRFMRGTAGLQKTPNNAELLVIAVSQTDRGKGVGKALVEKLRSRFQERCVESFRVITESGLVPANRFYQTLGFVREHTFSLYKKERTVYRFFIQQRETA